MQIERGIMHDDRAYRFLRLEDLLIFCSSHRIGRERLIRFPKIGAVAMLRGKDRI